jgi:hypothetical protein
MRQAAVLANLIPDSPEAHMRISFVTEGEASLHFAIERGLPDEVVGVSFPTRQTIWSIDPYYTTRVKGALSSSMQEEVPWILALTDVQQRLVLHMKNCQQRDVCPGL